MSPFVNNFLDKAVLTKKAQGVLNPMGGEPFFHSIKGAQIFVTQVAPGFSSLELGGGAGAPSFVTRERQNQINKTRQSCSKHYTTT